MSNDEDKLKALREMQELAANYIGPITKLEMGKRATRSKMYRHIRRKPHTAGRNNRVYAVAISSVSRVSSRSPIN
jgi:hypothetical protein